jgi:uncharacterized repeat protein (TIGR01451 family)
MKPCHWWTLLGVSGTGLAALLLGQSVLGQPDAKLPPIPMPTFFVSQPESPPAKSDGAKAAPETTTGHFRAISQTEPGNQTDGQHVQFPSQPRSPDSPGSFPAPTAPILQAGAQVFAPVPPPSSPTPLAPNATANKQISGTISVDVQPGRQQPSLSIEWSGPTSIRINQPMSCQIVVRNTSTTPAQNVVVRHRLGQSVTCKTSEPAAVHDSDELVWNLGTLAPQQARRIDLSLVSGTRGALNCHATVTFSAVAAYQVQVREPQLAVKMRGPDKVIAGENVTFVFAISNPGDGIAQAVKLKTTLPDGLEQQRGKLVEFDVGNLAPKEVRNVELVFPSKGSGTHKCAVVVSGEGGLVCDASAQFEILVPKLDITMSGPKLRYLDRHAIYVLRVTNPGSAPASNVEVQELIPAGFKFHQANNGGKYHDATRRVLWNLGELLPGQSKDIAVDLIPIQAGEHRLVAQAQAARGLKSETEARTMVEGLPALFIEVGHGDDPLEVGAETTYEIRVANTGTKMETNIEVVCTLPEQLEFRAAKCSTALRYRHEGRELIFETLPRLAPKADVIYRVQARGVAPGDIRFRTRIKADGLREPMQREESTRIYSDGAPLQPVPSAPAPISSVPAPVPAPMPQQLPVPQQLPPPGPPSLPAPGVPAPAPRPVLPSIPPLPSTSLAPVPQLPAPRHFPALSTLPALPGHS